MLTIKGTGVKAGEIPVAQSRALEYFKDIPAFLHKIDDVDQVRPLGRDGAYLVTHKPIGGMNYYVTVVYAFQAEFTPDGLVGRPLDFDVEKVKSEHPVLKGFVDTLLVTKPKSTETTSIDFKFTLTLEMPMAPALKLLPRPFVQATADGIMNLKVGATIDAFYKKVLTDFAIPV